LTDVPDCGALGVAVGVPDVLELDADCAASVSDPQASRMPNVVNLFITITHAVGMQLECRLR
jgi:hypothetical protein